ncbi:MAG: alpha/beta fold hydrolase [Frankiaceae bacterium]
MTLLGADRPWYSTAAPLPRTTWPTVAVAAEGAASVAKRAAAPVGLAGWGEGGVVALAVAALHPDLVDRVVLIGTPAPDAEVPWLPAEERALLDGVRDASPEEAHAAIAAHLAARVPRSPTREEALALLHASDADEAALARPGAADRLTAMVEAALAPGLDGLAGDLAALHLRPWGFAPEAVRARTLLLHGSKDPVAASTHARWWKAHVPDSRIEMSPGAGHLLVVPAWKRALAHLAPTRRG